MRHLLLALVFAFSLAAMACGDSVPEDRNADQSDRNTTVDGSGEGTGDPLPAVSGPNRISFAVGSGSLHSASYNAQIVITVQPVVQPVSTSNTTE